MAVEALCQRDASLVSADAVIKFAVITLEKQRSELAETLAVSIRSRIKERRSDFAGALIYLNNPKVTSTDDTFNVPKAATVRKIIQQLLLRLDHCPSTSAAVDGNAMTVTNENEAQASAGECDPPLPAKELSLKEQMEQAMKVSLSTRFSVESTTDMERYMASAVKTEMQLYCSSGSRGRCLERAYNYLMSIPATSVEAERALSAAGVLCSKMRSPWLSDDSIDTLCFLRSYYRKDRK